MSTYKGATVVKHPFRVIRLSDDQNPIAEFDVMKDAVDFFSRQENKKNLALVDRNGIRIMEHS